MIPSTNSRSRAVILIQNEPRAIYRSRAIMPSTNSKPRAMNTTSNAKRIDLK
jgi:hypothetical protein